MIDAADANGDGEVDYEGTSQWAKSCWFDHVI